MKREVSPWREEDLPRQAENSFTALDVRVTRRRLTMEEVEMEKVLMSVRDRMSWREVGGSQPPALGSVALWAAWDQNEATASHDTRRGFSPYGNITPALVGRSVTGSIRRCPTARLGQGCSRPWPRRPNGKMTSSPPPGHHHEGLFGKSLAASRSHVGYDWAAESVLLLIRRKLPSSGRTYSSVFMPETRLAALNYAGVDLTEYPAHTRAGRGSLKGHPRFLGASLLTN
ncbi:hypothetical protein BDFG_03983 [Blastomyces dermatitidis ATCC 26199]|nr:hypothetical protein BDFG_03983 [Blastomyces dermatitidis ATCC 26199]